MEAKVKCQTKVTIKEKMTGYFLATQGFTVFYALLFSMYALMSVYYYFKINENGTGSLIFSAAIAISALVGFMIPVFKGLFWSHKTKKKYGKAEVEYLCEFYDLYVRVTNLATNEVEKYDYRRATKSKITKHKKFFFIKFSALEFLVFKTSDFVRPTDYEKINGYVSRFTGKE